MLDQRKKKILGAVIDIYTETGEPVGSKALCTKLDIPLSPATVRKEMSDLITDGYLVQPHTSAGRIPTAMGYRTYIDDMMLAPELNEKQKQAIRNLFPKACEPEKLLEIAAHELANITNCTVFASVPGGKDTKIRKIEIVSMGKRAAMLVVVTGTGIIKTRFLYGFSGLTEEFCNQFSEFANKLLCGKKLTEISKDMLNQVALMLPDHILTVAPVLSEFGQLIEEASQSVVKLDGEANMFIHKEIGSTEAKDILEVLTKQETINEIVKAKNEVLSVLIGEETSYYQLKGASVVMRSYNLRDGNKGEIGIIGPVRMNYPEMISNIDYFAKILGDIYDDVLEE